MPVVRAWISGKEEDLASGLGEDLLIVVFSSS